MVDDCTEAAEISSTTVEVLDDVPTLSVVVSDSSLVVLDTSLVLVVVVPGAAMRATNLACNVGCDGATLIVTFIELLGSTCDLSGATAMVNVCCVLSDTYSSLVAWKALWRTASKFSMVSS